MIPRILQITTFGTVRSGKTSLALRLTGQVFDANYLPTSAVDFKVHTLPDPLLKDRMVKLDVWDTSGKQAYESLALTYFNDKTASPHLIRPLIIFFVIDATAPSLQDQFKKIRTGLDRSPSRAKLNLVLTKMDLLSQADQKIKIDYVKSFIEVEKHNHSLALHTVSAKTGLGIESLLEDTIKWIPPLSKDEQLKQLEDLQKSALKNVCKVYLKLTKKRIFSPTDSSRTTTIKNLQKCISEAKSAADITAALIEAVRDIRTPTENNRRKYGFTFFFGFFHYGDYKNSQLYKLINTEMKRIDSRSANLLEELSQPSKAANRQASAYKNSFVQ